MVINAVSSREPHCWHLIYKRVLPPVGHPAAIHHSGTSLPLVSGGKGRQSPKMSLNATCPAKHNAPKQRITDDSSPGCEWCGGGGRQLPTAGRTEGQSGALADSRSCKAVPAHPAHVQQITRADSDPGSFTALIFSLE